MTINSDQVNYLVLRYLLESGFEHAAFTLKNEMRNAEGLDTAWATRVPTGHLVNSLQKAVMFEECLAQVDEEGHVKDAEEVAVPGLIPGTTEKLQNSVSTNGTSTVKRKASETEKAAPTEKRAKTPPVEQRQKHTETKEIRDVVMTDRSATPTPAADKTPLLRESLLLKGHTGGLDQCTWSPTHGDVLATSSVDGTARIWTLPSTPGTQPTSVVLNCSVSRTKDKSVTGIAWNRNGSHLATGSYDGVVRIWTASGAKHHRDLTFHSGPVFALQWSPSSDFVLTGAGEGQVGLWNISLGNLQQKWDLKSPVLDVEWISGALFLAGCKNGKVKMFQLGRDSPVKQFEGHEADLTVLKWNSNINLGVTGADDGVVKVWRADSETPTQVLRHHKGPVHTLEWAHKDFGDLRLMASAARDGRVCVWDVVRGDLVHVLHHDRAIFALHFSATNLLATSGAEGETSVWNAETGRLMAVDRQQEHSMVYNIKFSNNGEKLVLARANDVGMILDMPSI